MFNKRYHPIVMTTEALLYDILEQLKALNESVNGKIVFVPTIAQTNGTSSPEPIIVPLSTDAKGELQEAKVDGIQCKYCGGTHENKGQMMACAKKMKKEGAQNVSADRQNNEKPKRNGSSRNSGNGNRFADRRKRV